MKAQLSESRMLERVIFKAPELTDDIKETFPSLEPMEQAILAMEQDANNFEYTVFCTPYVRKREDGNWFVDIYFVYNEDALETYRRNRYKRRVITRRIIIAPGYMLSEEVEYLIECLDMDRFIMFIRFNERVTGSFVKGLSMIAPELHIENYDSPVDAFKLAYSSRYKSSLREFLLFFLIY